MVSLELQKKKKRSLTVICTLGIAAIPFEKVLNSRNTLNGFSFNEGAIGFVLRGIVMFTIAFPCLIIGFIYHFIRYFYLWAEEIKLKNIDSKMNKNST